MFRNIAIGAASAAVVAGTVLTGAGMASAAPLPNVHASTQIKDRLDSGNGGYWAKDQLGRDLWVKLIHQGGGTWTWVASIQDKGQFVTIPNALGPNQSGPYTNKREGHKAAVGQFQGGDTWTFTTDSLPSHSWNAGVPSHVNGSGEPTSTWYEQAFPGGTNFTNVHQGQWSWTYTAAVKTTKVIGYHKVYVFKNGHKVKVNVPIYKTTTQHQKWVDSSATSNHDGNAPFDGDILLP